MSQNVLSAAVVIGVLRLRYIVWRTYLFWLYQMFAFIALEKKCLSLNDLPKLYWEEKV